MHDTTCSSAIECWLAEVRMQFVNEAPGLLSLFDTYASEAVFGRRYIDVDVRLLQRGARILEIGAGSLLLSCQLVREGFLVSALEPTSIGFSHFDQMRQMILRRAVVAGCCPAVLDISAESLAVTDAFDYSFSVNVMEHVDDVERVLSNVCRSLVAGGMYRFTCPNYLFPYEPHFNIPTFFSKKLTEVVLRDKISGSKNLPDPEGTWKSLNWINVMQVKRCCKSLIGISLRFNRTMSVSTLERIVTDPHFAARRSGIVRVIILALVRWRIHRLFGLVPAVFQPIIDCRLTKGVISERC